MNPVFSWTERIEAIMAHLVNFCASNSDLVTTFFLTGSYARSQHSSNSPNVNLYFISAPDRSIQLRIALSSQWDDLRHMLGSDHIDLLIDCHPYTVSARHLDAINWPRLTITSKVLDAKYKAIRYSLPPTIGLGWLKAYKVLWGDAQALDCLAIQPVPDTEWFHALHEALSRYRNLLDHLPWALPWKDHPRWLAEESLRYAEEAIRDGIPVVLTAQELMTGFQFEVYFNWKTEALPFFGARYGPRGEWAVAKLAEMKRSVAEQATWEPDQSRQLLEEALEIWGVVWGKFCERVQDECPAHANWLTRVNSFV